MLTLNVDENIAFQLFVHALIEFVGNSFRLEQKEQTNKLALIIITLFNPNSNVVILILTSNHSLNPDPHQGDFDDCMLKTIKQMRCEVSYLVDPNPNPNY